MHSFSTTGTRRCCSATELQTCGIISNANEAWRFCLVFVFVWSVSTNGGNIGTVGCFLHVIHLWNKTTDNLNVKSTLKMLHKLGMMSHGLGYRWKTLGCCTVQIWCRVDLDLTASWIKLFVRTQCPSKMSRVCTSCLSPCHLRQPELNTFYLWDCSEEWGRIPTLQDGGCGCRSHCRLLTDVPRPRHTGKEPHECWSPLMLHGHKLEAQLMESKVTHQTY